MFFSSCFWLFVSFQLFLFFSFLFFSGFWLFASCSFFARLTPLSSRRISDTHISLYWFVSFLTFLSFPSSSSSPSFVIIIIIVIIIIMIEDVILWQCLEATPVPCLLPFSPPHHQNHHHYHHQNHDLTSSLPYSAYSSRSSFDTTIVQDEDHILTYLFWKDQRCQNDDSLRSGSQTWYISFLLLFPFLWWPWIRVTLRIFITFSGLGKET